MHRLEAEYWGQVDFIYIDREYPDNRDVVDQFGIVYQPVFILLDAEGNEVRRWFAFAEGEIVQALNDISQ